MANENLDGGLTESEKNLISTVEKWGAPTPLLTPEIVPQDNSSKDVGILADVGRGFRMGAKQLEGTVQGLTAFGAQSLGVDPAISENILKQAGKTFKAAEQVGPSVQSASDIEGLGSAAHWAAGQFGALIPTLAPALITGGGLAAPIARRAVTGAVEKAAEGSILESVLQRSMGKITQEQIERATAEKVAQGMAEGAARELAEQESKALVTTALEDPIKRAAITKIGEQAATVGNAAAMAGLNIGQETGNIYSKIYEETGVQDPKHAALYGSLSGLVGSLGDIVYGAKLIGLSPAIKKDIANTIKGRLFSAGKTGAEAAALGAGTAGVQNLLQRESVQEVEEKPWTPEDTKAFWNSVAAGGSMGFAMGALGGLKEQIGEPTKKVSGKVEVETPEAVTPEVATPEAVTPSGTEATIEPTAKPKAESFTDIMERVNVRTQAHTETADAVLNSIDRQKAVQDQTGASTEATRTAMAAVTGKEIADDVSKMAASKKKFVPMTVETEAPVETVPVVENPSEPSAPALQPSRLPVEVPVENIKHSKDLAQFKSGANEVGVVSGKELGGDYVRDPLKPIVVWERKDGAQEVATGRHRLDLAKRSGEKTIPAQIYREADGYTAEYMRNLDAAENIRDEQGSITDFARHFRSNKALDEKIASKQGLLARAPGKLGFQIGKNASDDLYSAVQAGRIDEKKAAAIAATAPKDDNIQRAAMRASNGLTAAELPGFINHLKTLVTKEEFQSDLFGVNDSALNESIRLAKLASSKADEIGEQISSVRGAAKKPALAAKLGVDVSDPEGVLNKMKALSEQQRKYAEFWKHPEIKAELLAESEARMHPESKTATEPARSVESAPEETSVAEKAVQDDVDMFGEKVSASPKTSNEILRTLVKDGTIDDTTSTKIQFAMDEAGIKGTSTPEELESVLMGMVKSGEITKTTAKDVSHAYKLGQEAPKEAVVTEETKSTAVATEPAKASLKTVPTTGKGKEHYNVVAETVKKVASAFPERKVRFVESEPGAREAYYDPKTGIHTFVTDNISDPKRAAQLFFHEATHGNLARMDATPVATHALDGIFRRAESMLKSESESLAKSAGFDSTEHMSKEYGYDMNTPTGRREMNGELLSRFAERFSDKPAPTWWKRTLAEVKSWISKFFGLDMSASDVEHFLMKEMKKPAQELGIPSLEIKPSLKRAAVLQSELEASKMSVEELGKVEKSASKASLADPEMTPVLDAIQRNMHQKSLHADRPVDGVTTIDSGWARRVATSSTGAISDATFESALRSRLRGADATYIEGGKETMVTGISSNKVWLSDGTSVPIARILNGKAGIRIDNDSPVRPSAATQPKSKVDPSVIPASFKGMTFDEAGPTSPRDKVTGMLRKGLTPLVGEEAAARVTGQGADIYKKGGLFGSGDIPEWVRNKINEKNAFVAAQYKKVEFASKEFMDAIKRNFPNGMDADAKKTFNAASGNIAQELTTKQRNDASVVGRAKYLATQDSWVKKNHPILETELSKRKTPSERNSFLHEQLGSEEYNRMKSDAAAAHKVAYDMHIASARAKNYGDALAIRKAALESLPKDVSDSLTRMTEVTDELMAYGLKNNLIPEKESLAFGNGPGLYTTKSFKIHDDPEWKAFVKSSPDAKAAGIRDDLADFLQRSMIEKEAKNLVSENDAEIRAGKNIDRLSMEDALRAAGSMVSVDDVVHAANRILESKNEFDLKHVVLKDILGKETAIPEAVLKAWGEYDEPGVNFAKTIQKAAQMIASNRMMEELREGGTREGWLVGIPEGGIPPEGYVQIKPIGEFQSMKALAGLYAKKEFVDFFNKYYDPAEEGKIHQAFRALALATTLAKTTLSPTGAAKNFFGNVPMMLAAGNLDLSQSGTAWQAAMANLRGKGTREHQAYVTKLIELGVLSDNVGPRFVDELRKTNSLKSADEVQKTLVDNLVNPKRDWYKSAKGIGEKIIDTGGKLYGAMDEFFKVMAFESEKNKAKKLDAHMAEIDKNYVRKSESQIDAEAAEWVQRVLPTYSRAPQFVKDLKMVPVLGQFSTFTAEMMRTSTNVVTRAMTDAMSKDAYVKAEGMKGLARIASVMAAPAALYMASKAAVGITDEEEKAFRDSLPPWQKNSEIVFLGKDGDEKITYLDNTYVDNYAYFKQPFKAALSTLNGEPKNIGKAAVAGVLEVMKPFVGADIATSAATHLYFNQKSDGSRIYNPEDPNKWEDALGYFWKQSQPGITKLGTDLYKGFSGESDPVTEGFGAIGFKPQVNDPIKALNFTAWKTTNRLRDANTILIGALHRGEDPASAVERVNEAREDIIGDVRKLYLGALERGATTAEASAVLKRVNLSPDVIKQIRGGYINPYMPSKKITGGMPAEELEKLQEAMEGRERRYLNE